MKSIITVAALFVSWNVFADANTVVACLNKNFAASNSACTVDAKDVFQPDSAKDSWDFSAYCGLDYKFDFTATTQDAWNTCQIVPDGVQQ